MIRSEKIAKKINEKIKEWGKDHAKLIVAIDGYAGSGKTTVGDFVGKHNNDVLSIHLDDFIKHYKVRKRMMNSAKDKSKVFEYSWYRYNDLERLMKSFLNGKKNQIYLKTYDYKKKDFGPKKSFDVSKKVLVINGIFLFHPKHKLAKFIDKKVYLDVDWVKADKRRISREKKKWGKNHLPDNHPDNWVNHFKVAYGRYIKQYNPKNRADLIFKV